jgi:hypothetical protein
MDRRIVLGLIAGLALIALACSASSLITKFFGSGGSIDSRIQDVEDELTSGNDTSTTCDPNWWSTDYWEINILPLLSENKAHCWDFSSYQTCVQDRARAGDCPGEASNYCAPVYQQLLNESTQGEIKLRDDSLYVRDDDNTFAIQFSLGGGPVEGFVMIDYRTEYGDGDYCEVTQEKVFSGSFWDGDDHRDS